LHPTDDTKHHLTAVMITQVVMGCAFIFASITCLKPFLRPFHPVAFGGSAPANGLFRYTAEPKGSRSDRYYELSGARSAADGKRDVVTTTRSVADDSTSDQEDLIEPANRPPPTFRPIGVEHTAQAVSTGGRHNGGDGKLISKTRSWTVSVNQA
jgi:hypothetical protein